MEEILALGMTQHMKSWLSSQTHFEIHSQEGLRLPAVGVEQSVLCTARPPKRVLEPCLGSTVVRRRAEPSSSTMGPAGLVRDPQDGVHLPPAVPEPWELASTWSGGQPPAPPAVSALQKALWGVFSHRPTCHKEPPASKSNPPPCAPPLQGHYHIPDTVQMLQIIFILK